VVSTFFFSPRETHALTITMIDKATVVTIAGVWPEWSVRENRSARYMESSFDVVVGDIAAQWKGKRMSRPAEESKAVVTAGASTM
jgi:hypothetical protein